jgi:hypothetical protein
LAPTHAVVMKHAVKKITAKVTPNPAKNSGKKSGGIMGTILAILGVLVVVGLIVFGVLKSGLLKRFSKEASPPSQEGSPSVTTETSPDQAVPANAPQEQPVFDAATQNADENKEYYIKKVSEDEKGVWVTLTDDNGPIDGYYPSKDIKEGFAKVKGEMQKDKDKSYLLISEVLPDA